MTAITMDIIIFYDQNVYNNHQHGKEKSTLFPLCCETNNEQSTKLPTDLKLDLGGPDLVTNTPNPCFAGGC